MWLTKDSVEFINNPIQYKIYFNKPKESAYVNGRWYNYDYAFCVEDFEKATGFKILSNEILENGNKFSIEISIKIELI